MTSWVPIIRASGYIGSIIPYTHTTVKHQKLERSARFELATTCLEGRRSDRTELTPQNCANTAEDGRNRTPGPFRLAPLSRRALHPRQHRLPKLVENVGFEPTRLSACKANPGAQAHSPNLDARAGVKPALNGFADRRIVSLPPGEIYIQKTLDCRLAPNRTENQSAMSCLLPNIEGIEPRAASCCLPVPGTGGKNLPVYPKATIQSVLQKLSHQKRPAYEYGVEVTAQPHLVFCFRPLDRSFWRYGPPYVHGLCFR